jgi:hypothetical protein
MREQAIWVTYAQLVGDNPILPMARDRWPEVWDKFDAENDEAGQSYRRVAPLGPASDAGVGTTDQEAPSTPAPTPARTTSVTKTRTKP